ncbi:MAG: aminotransferase class V-fold PLP-dependent enzyme [Acidimicrobiia bacterium]
MRSLWALDPDIAALNHGSFGATPRAVLTAQRRVRDRLESNPTEFFEDHYQPELDAARTTLAAFLGTDPAGLAFVTNATTAVAAVVGSIEFDRGDEILITDHTYNACRNTVEVAAARAGASVVVAALPFVGASPESVAEGILTKVTSRTRLVVVDHVTSPTALVFPIERIISELEPHVPVLVDGAHAPGMIPLDLTRLGASYYAGNLHKWVCAPKGAGFLVVAEHLRDQVRPTVISHGWNTARDARSMFQRLFDWTGTFDPSAWLTVPDAIAFMASLDPAGWPGVMAANHGLALAARDLLGGRLGIDAPVPEEMIGSMAALPLAGTRPGLAERLRRQGIVAPIPPWPSAEHHLVRVSAQRYNTLDEYDRLADAILAD